MPLLKKRRVLAAKQETTVGTPIALTSGVDEMINAYDVQIDADIGYNERVYEGAFGRQAGVTGTRAGSLKFKIEAAGSGAAGTAPAYALTLLPACGMTTAAGVFSPSSAFGNQKSITIAVYEDGIVKKLVGAMGSWKFDAEDGHVPYFEFDFKGVWASPADATMFTPQFSAVIPPRFTAATLTIGAYTPTCSKISLDYGNKVELREDVTNVTGFISAIIVDRVPKGQLDPEATTIATYDAFGIFTAGTTAALTCTYGSSGTGLTIASPALQYSGIKEGDRNGKVTHNLDFMVLQNGSSPDDELTITY